MNKIRLKRRLTVLLLLLQKPTRLLETKMNQQRPEGCQRSSCCYFKAHVISSSLNLERQLTRIYYLCEYFHGKSDSSLSAHNIFPSYNFQIISISADWWEGGLLGLNSWISQLAVGGNELKIFVTISEWLTEKKIVASNLDIFTGVF